MCHRMLTSAWQDPAEFWKPFLNSRLAAVCCKGISNGHTGENISKIQQTLCAHAILATQASLKCYVNRCTNRWRQSTHMALAGALNTQAPLYTSSKILIYWRVFTRLLHVKIHHLLREIGRTCEAECLCCSRWHPATAPNRLMIQAPRNQIP